MGRPLPRRRARHGPRAAGGCCDPPHRGRPAAPRPAELAALGRNGAHRRRSEAASGVAVATGARQADGGNTSPCSGQVRCWAGMDLVWVPALGQGEAGAPTHGARARLTMTRVLARSCRPTFHRGEEDAWWTCWGRACRMARKHSNASLVALFVSTLPALPEIAYSRGASRGVQTFPPRAQAPPQHCIDAPLCHSYRCCQCGRHVRSDVSLRWAKAVCLGRCARPASHLRFGHGCPHVAAKSMREVVMHSLQIVAQPFLGSRSGCCLGSVCSSWTHVVVSEGLCSKLRARTCRFDLRPSTLRYFSRACGQDLALWRGRSAHLCS